MKPPLAAKGGGGSGDLLITCANVMMGKKNVISAVVVVFTRHDRSFSRRLKNTVAASLRFSAEDTQTGGMVMMMDGRGTGRERENDDGNITDTHKVESVY